MGTENHSKPAHASSRIAFIPGKGYVVLDPEGGRAGGASPFRIQAEQLRDRLQREADAKAKRGRRACLCCGATFVSEGIHHRLCTSCRHRSDDGFIPTGIARPARRRGGARNG